MKNIFKIIAALSIFMAAGVPVSYGLVEPALTSSQHLDQSIAYERGFHGNNAVQVTSGANFLTDLSGVFSSFQHGDKDIWLKASILTGITAVIYQYDQPIQRWAQRKRSATSDGISSFAGQFGGNLSMAPAAGFYLYGCIANDSHAHQTAVFGIESLAISSLLTNGMKRVFHRHRPNSGASFNEWDGPKLSNANVSFPSGHSSAAFSMAAVIASEYGRHRFVVPAAYGLATMTALSRINDNEHWASDVFVGSAIGYFSAKALLHSRKKHASISESVTSDGQTPILLYSFKF